MQRLPSLIIISVIVLLFVTGCQKEVYPETKQDRKIQRSSTGVYTKVIRKSSDKPVTGELIFIDDSLILLTERHDYVRMSVEDIQSMTSQVSGTKPKTYLLITGLTLIPMTVGLLAHSKHSDSPKAIGLMATSPGLIVALVESLKKPQVISYPDDASLEDFRKYAKFPEVFPYHPAFEDLISSASIGEQKVSHENAAAFSQKQTYGEFYIKKR